MYYLHQVLLFYGNKRAKFPNAVISMEFYGKRAEFRSRNDLILSGGSLFCSLLSVFPIIHGLI